MQYDPNLLFLKDMVYHSNPREVFITEALQMHVTICMLTVDWLSELIFEEANLSRHSAHPGAANKLYDLTTLLVEKNKEIYSGVYGSVFELSVCAVRTSKTNGLL